ncbi:hypothetical protein ACH4TX_06870 [Streptomyces sp. NPDC021098]|uniref:hypothetical protein n=1 Tax=unclassified Streptomyces TaxID=2593676 RepID=UPI0037A087F8
MSIRHTTKARRGAAAAALGAALALAVAGCGSGDDGEKGNGSPQKSPAVKTDDGQGETEPAGDSKKVIGEMKGPKGIVVTIHSAKRDSGGFVTVSGTVSNRGSEIFNADWRSTEVELVKSRSSLAGASLVDEVGKKRYLVLRDTDGQCLCTTQLYQVKPNESRPVFAQFPAPPKSVTEVDFQLPTMPSVSIKLSG